MTEEVTDGTRYDTKQAIKLEIPHELWGMRHKYGKDDGSLHGGRHDRQMRGQVRGGDSAAGNGVWDAIPGGCDPSPRVRHVFRL